MACFDYICSERTKSLTATKYRKFIIFSSITTMVLWCLYKWKSLTTVNDSLPSLLSVKDPHFRIFTLGKDNAVYMYSAIVKLNTELNKTEALQSADNTTEIVITTLDGSQANLFCCVLLPGSNRKKVLRTPAKVYYKNKVKRQTSDKTIYEATQFVCRIPDFTSHLAAPYVTLTSSNCSQDINDYLPAMRPPRVPGGLALCGKIAHSGGLDPEKVIEWFEVQRILGVDKILIYDLGNPENLTRVFRYYQKLGILDLQPYELPGNPRNRLLIEDFKSTTQFNHDETMAVLECRLRMGGYDYIASHDIDEMIIPRKNVKLKEFLKEHIQKEPNAAGFYFHVEFFITTWGPTNPEEDLMVKRYRKSTEPRWECYKYVYLPSRVLTSITHNFMPSSSSFISPKISPSDAILHHYRQCPEDTWGTCSVKTITDNIMTRYTDLEDRVDKVRKATSTQPRWTPVTSPKT